MSNLAILFQLFFLALNYMYITSHNLLCISCHSFGSLGTVSIVSLFRSLNACVLHSSSSCSIQVDFYFDHATGMLKLMHSFQASYCLLSKEDLLLLILCAFGFSETSLLWFSFFLLKNCSKIYVT